MKASRRKARCLNASSKNSAKSSGCAPSCAAWSARRKNKIRGKHHWLAERIAPLCTSRELQRGASLLTEALRGKLLLLVQYNTMFKLTAPPRFLDRVST